MYTPYGTFPVDVELRRRYDVVFPYSDSIPLPAELPLHHPTLEALCGRTPLFDQPGPWWPEFVGICHEDLQPLLLSVSAQEYRYGVIADKRWRAFKQAHPDVPVRKPRIGELLALRMEHSCTGGWPQTMVPIWEKLWRERGPRDTPEQMELVIATRPEYWINMSSGNGWDSCMTLSTGGDFLESLPGNFYDLGAALALLIPQGADIWQKNVVIARTTLRLVQTKRETLVVLGQCYHNNRTAVQWLLVSLITLLEKQQLSWGIIYDTNTEKYWRDGHLGSAFQPAISTVVKAYGDPVYLPPGNHSLPILDGEADWVRDEDHRHDSNWARVRARVRLPHALV